MKKFFKNKYFGVFIIFSFLIYMMSNGEWCVPIFAWIYPILFLCMVDLNHTRKVYLIISSCRWICCPVWESYWNGYKDLYNGSSFVIFSESFTIYLLVKIQNEISGHSYFCKYHGINRVYHLFNISHIGRAVGRLYTIPKSISDTNSNDNRDLRNHFFNVLDGGNGSVDLEQ